MVRQRDPPAVPELGVDISTLGMDGVRNHPPAGYLLWIKQSGDAGVTGTLEASAESESNRWAMLGIFIHTC